MVKSEDRIRVYISKKKYDKINKYAKEKGLLDGRHIIDEIMCDFIDKYNL